MNHLWKVTQIADCVCGLLSFYQHIEQWADKSGRAVFLTLRWVLYAPGFVVPPLSPWNLACMWLCSGPAWTIGLEGTLVSLCLKIPLWKSLKEFRCSRIWRSWEGADVSVLTPTHIAQSSVRVPQREAATSPMNLKSFAFILLSGLLFYAFPWVFFRGGANRYDYGNLKILLDMQDHFKKLDINPNTQVYLIFQAPWIDIHHTIHCSIHNLFPTHTPFAFPGMFLSFLGLRILFVIDTYIKKKLADIIFKRKKIWFIMNHK